MSKFPIENPYDFRAVTELINAYAESDSTEIVFAFHATERMEERKIDREWIKKTLCEGNVIDVREHTNRTGKVSYRYRVALRLLTGQTVVITTIPKAHCLTIITDW